VGTGAPVEEEELVAERVTEAKVEVLVSSSEAEVVELL